MNSLYKTTRRTVSAVLMSLMIAVFTSGCVTPEQTSYNTEEMNNMLWYLSYDCQDTGIKMQSRVFVPGIPPNKYPLVLFLHCAGHEGSDNVSHLYEGDLGKLIYYSDKNQKCVIAAPQCPIGKMWSDDDMIETLNSYIDYVASRIWVVDKTKVYVTGFSMGGLGTYRLILEHPDRFTTAMPVCGGPKNNWTWDKPDVPSGLSCLNIWSFNNINDPIVNNVYSKYVVGNLWDNGCTNVHYTEGMNGHVDEYVFSNKEMLKWFLSQKRAE